MVFMVEGVIADPSIYICIYAYQYLGGASLRFKKRQNFSINPQKQSILSRVFWNRSEALVVLHIAII